MDRDEIKESLVWYDRVYRGDKTAFSVMNLADKLYAKGSLPAAADWYERYLPTHADGRIVRRLADIYFEIKQPDKASKHYENLLARYRVSDDEELAERILACYEQLSRKSNTADWTDRLGKIVLENSAYERLENDACMLVGGKHLFCRQNGTWILIRPCTIASYEVNPPQFLSKGDSMLRLNDRTLPGVPARMEVTRNLKRDHALHEGLMEYVSKNRIPTHTEGK